MAWFTAALTWLGSNAGTVGTVASVAGTTLSAVSAYRSGQAQKEAYKYSSEIARRKGQQEEQIHRDKLRKLMSSQRALYAKAGVDLSSGSPLLLLTETAEEGERDAIRIRHGAKEESNLGKYYGRQARRAGATTSGSTLLTGLGSTAMNYYDKRTR